MIKSFITLTTSTALIALLSSTEAFAHLALDHLKQDLDSRFKDVYSSNKLNQSYKANALSALRLLQTRYSSAASLSTIPSQKKAAEEMCQQLSREIQNFDRMLNEYKSASSEKPEKE